jgi:Icc-related predicted phosphoesterase
MRLALISDTHGNLPVNFPNGIDAVIHAGDLGPDARPREWWESTFRLWAARANVPIYATFGNHDREWPPLASTPSNLEIIVDDVVDIGGKKVWFTPWVTNLPNWAWNATEDVLKDRYALIPDDIDILVSHAPPYGYTDHLDVYGRVGGKALAERLQDIKPLVICGHIHEGRGLCVKDGLTVLNVASLDGSYEPYPDRWTILEI